MLSPWSLYNCPNWMTFIQGPNPPKYEKQTPEKSGAFVLSAKRRMTNGGDRLDQPLRPHPVF